MLQLNNPRPPRRDWAGILAALVVLLVGVLLLGVIVVGGLRLIVWLWPW